MSGKMARYKIIIEMDADLDIANEVEDLLGQKIDDMWAEETDPEVKDAIESFVVSFEEV